MTHRQLDLTDAIELAETLQFLIDWINHDPDRLTTSLTQFVGNTSYTTADLTRDLHRFNFLIGATNGEALFDTGQQH